MSRLMLAGLIVILVPTCLLGMNRGKERAHGQHQAAARSAAVPSGVRLAELQPSVLVCDSVPAAPASREYRAVKMKVTAYCLCNICCEKWADLPNRVTSTGDNAKIYDGVAADPKRLPYRTKLDIPGIGVREVDDTGGGMRKSTREGITHIDVRMASHSEARRWGVKFLEVKILN